MELTDLAKISNKYRKNIFNTAIIILAVFISFNMYKKQYKGIELLQKEKDEEVKKNDILEGIGKAERKIQAYKNFLTVKDASTVMNSINYLARESKVSIQSIRPDAEQKNIEYIVKHPFIILISAPTYETLGHFISRLESHQDIYTIDAIDIKLSEQAKELDIILKISSTASKN